MFGKHVVKHLSEYTDGELSLQAKSRVEAHLRQCSNCREALEEIRLGSRLASTLAVSSAPQVVWSREAVSRPLAGRGRLLTGIAAAGLVFGIALLTFLYRNPISSTPSWEVTGIAGTSRLHAGEVLQTDSASAVQVKIADIGQLLVNPNTRIRLLVSRTNQHKIALDRGKVEATTWAPPRLFIVETPSATAVDLGCRYTMEVENDGSSLLHVTLGLVALERESGEIVVPAGAFCRTRRGKGPGTPYFEDSSASFQAALDRVDSLPEGPERANQLEIVLREAQVRDGLSLWHLIPRMTSESRRRVYDRLAKLIPPPSGVTRDGIASLDSKMLDAWKQVVSQLWQ